MTAFAASSSEGARSTASHRPSDRPSDRVLRRYARYLGIDLDNEPLLLPVLRAALTEPLPNGWELHVHQDWAMPYFYFAQDDRSYWQHPRLNLYLEQLEALRAATADDATAQSTPTKRPSKLQTKLQSAWLAPVQDRWASPSVSPTCVLRADELGCARSPSLTADAHVGAGGEWSPAPTRQQPWATPSLSLPSSALRSAPRMSLSPSSRGSTSPVPPMTATAAATAAFSSPLRGSESPAPSLPPSPPSPPPPSSAAPAFSRPPPQSARPSRRRRCVRPPPGAPPLHAWDTGAWGSQKPNALPPPLVTVHSTPEGDARTRARSEAEAHAGGDGADDEPLLSLRELSMPLVNSARFAYRWSADAGMSVVKQAARWFGSTPPGSPSAVSPVDMVS